MAVDKNWIEAHGKAVARWHRLATFPIAQAPDDYLAELHSKCPFRSQAQSDIDSLGVPKEGVELNAEDFCHGCLDLGGCDPTVEQMVEAIAERRYDDATRLAAEFHDRLKGLTLPDLGD